MSSNDPVRLGILSTALISATIANAVKPLPTITVTAIASRSLAKAEAFASKHNIPSAVVYEDILSQPIDAVYIPLPTALVADWAVRCAEAGFHVLADKPFASAAAVRRILDACNANNVMFMDATHFVHSTRARMVDELVTGGPVGRVRRVIATFTVPIALTDNIRADPALEPYGGLGDLGWYTVRALVSYANLEKDRNVKTINATGVWSEKHKGCLIGAEGVILFEGEERLVLCFSCNMNEGLRQTVEVIGSEGVIQIPNFVVPLNSTDYWESTRPKENYSTDTVLNLITCVSGYNGNGEAMLRYPKEECIVVKETGALTQPSMMLREFARIIKENDVKKAHYLAGQTLKTQSILDMIWEQLVDARDQA